mmetsp:Transcript_4359/g.14149  ORF Transcript_4359/g.14149 Transcript_4359/m.14149 type:complete len:218 (-) Transcript_4359:3303-3956(-)
MAVAKARAASRSLEMYRKSSTTRSSTPQYRLPAADRAFASRTRPSVSVPVPVPVPVPSSELKLASSACDTTRTNFFASSRPYSRQHSMDESTEPCGMPTTWRKNRPSRRTRFARTCSCTSANISSPATSRCTTPSTNTVLRVRRASDSANGTKGAVSTDASASRPKRVPMRPPPLRFTVSYRRTTYRSVSPMLSATAARSCSCCAESKACRTSTPAT